jgi:hypothetical protein
MPTPTATCFDPGSVLLHRLLARARLIMRDNEIESDQTRKPEARCEPFKHFCFCRKPDSFGFNERGLKGKESRWYAGRIGRDDERK